MAPLLISNNNLSSFKNNKTLAAQCVQQGSKYIGEYSFLGPVDHWSECAFKCFSKPGCDGWSWDYAKTEKECSVFTVVAEQIIGTVHRSVDTSLLKKNFKRYLNNKSPQLG